MKRTPMKRTNRKRKAAAFSKAFGDIDRVAFVRGLGCLICGDPAEAAHVRSRAAGGGPDDLVPLCRVHHRSQHSLGIRTFEFRHGLDLTAAAAWCAEVYHHHTGAA